MVSLYTGTVPNLTQSQPDFDTNTQAILDYIASLAPELNAWVGAYVQDTSSTSSTSNSVGTGSKTFTVEAGKGYKVNMPVRASATTGNYMDGVVTAYSGTSLTVNFTAATGSGTFASWQIFITIAGSISSPDFSGGADKVPVTNPTGDGWLYKTASQFLTFLGILDRTNDSAGSSTSSTLTVSPSWLKSGFAASLTHNGYIKFPNWLGGIVLQWGVATVSSAGTLINFNMTFPNFVLNIQTNTTGASSPATQYAASQNINTAQFRAWANTGTMTVYWFAIGY